jgi:hypothetical protein
LKVLQTLSFCGLHRFEPYMEVPFFD